MLSRSFSLLWYLKQRDRGGERQGTEGVEAVETDIFDYITFITLYTSTHEVATVITNVGDQSFNPFERTFDPPVNAAYGRVSLQDFNSAQYLSIAEFQAYTTGLSLSFGESEVWVPRY